HSSFFFIVPPAPRSPLFPYTTLFRSRGTVVRLAGANGAAAEVFGRPTTNEGYHIGDAPGQLALRLGVHRRRGRGEQPLVRDQLQDRKSTRLNSSHQIISYAVFCLKKK